MFESLTHSFKQASLKFKGQAQYTENNLEPALQSLKTALLDADVDLHVSNQFLDHLKKDALGQIVTLKTSGKQVSLEQHFIKLCHDKILELLQPEKAFDVSLEKTSKPMVILMVGLQGAGKTTQSAKIAKWYKDQGKSCLLVAADIYRPAAREQLNILGQQLAIPVFTLPDPAQPLAIVKEALEYATEQRIDRVIIDTAGRLALDSLLMEELTSLQSFLKPQYTWLTLDAMIGQQAVHTAKAFNQAVPLTGLVLTKMDGDTRGGAALSVKTITGLPIVFAGYGEHLDKLERFRPEGMASRILGMGDIVSLMEDFNKSVDEESAKNQAQRMMQGQFDFNDYLSFLNTLKKMGGIKDVMSKMPLPGGMSLPTNMDESSFRKRSYVIQSMTLKEKKQPRLLDGGSAAGRSRLERIAKGSGQGLETVKKCVDEVSRMQSMMKMFKSMGGMGALMKKIPGLGGSLPDFSSLMGMPGEGIPSLDKNQIAELNRIKKLKKREKALKEKKRK